MRWELGTGADKHAYENGHVSGAAFIDLDRDLADPPSQRGRHPLPAAERFTAAMRAAGVSSRRPVVVYDAGTAMAAARAWWLLRYFGHPHVRVLDGGLAAWTSAGYPVSNDVPAPPPGDLCVHPGALPILLAEDVQPFLAGGGVLLDARTHERFVGRSEPVDPVAGHIPGALSRPTAENLDPEGRFRIPATLREDFARLGARPDASVAAYCGSGVTAAHEVLALELAGIKAALYPGSWSEWISDPDRPVAQGEP